MAKPNKAMARWLKRHRHTQTALARRLDVHISTVNELLHGKKAPSLGLALKLERETGIPPRAFKEVA